MLLAGDIGGTNTRLGLFDGASDRPRPLGMRAFATLDYTDLSAMLSAFIAEFPAAGTGVRTACFGVAGPVTGDSAALTNVPWSVDAVSVARAFGIRRVALLNDLQAMAYSVPKLDPSEVYELQRGDPSGPRSHGNIGLIAAGTGLGEALLHDVDGRYVPSPSEGGHADFAARNEREIALVRQLIQRFGRAEVENVVSGRGLANIQRITHAQGDGACRANIDPEDDDAPAKISAAALARTCASCETTLEMFVEAYGAEAGNLALRSVATGGVFIGGGIAPKILPALATGRFVRAFREKAPLDRLLAQIPVKVILNDDAGLLGAAIYASMLDARAGGQDTPPTA
jgi:glucokinase